MPLGRFTRADADRDPGARIRYKDSDANQSKLIRQTYGGSMRRAEASLKFQFAAGVSEFAMQLRRSQYLEVARTQALLDQVDRAKPLDEDGAVAELYQLIELARSLAREPLRP